MGKRIGFVGAGAVGGYVAAYLAMAGEDVLVIDQWPAHINRIKRDGIAVSGTQGEHLVRLKALHIHEVQTLLTTRLDVAFICTKSYDTEWATALIHQYLAPDAFVVSLQNGINEDRIASIVGWGKTVGCIASTIGVDAFAPGKIMRTMDPGGSSYDVFRVGEPHGRLTARIQDVARMLRAVDSARVTTNLWGERWAKLTTNAMSNGISAATGLSFGEMAGSAKVRHLSIRLAGEAVRVGLALGYDIEHIRGISPGTWVEALEGNEVAFRLVENVLVNRARPVTEAGRPSTAQDIIKGRRTEIEFINGLVAAKGEETGALAPTNSAITELVLLIQTGAVTPHPSLIDKL